MADDRLKISIELDTGEIQKGFATIENQSRKSGQKVGNNLQKGIAGSSFKNVFGSLTGQVAALGTALAGAFTVRGIFEAGKNIETLETRFTTLLGSAGAASKQIADLQQFAANTPFQLNGLADASAQLLSFGFESDTIIDRLGKIGDVAAGSNSDLKDVALIYGQIAAAGKLTGERLLQLQERGIPIGSALAKSLGVAESEVRNLVSSGKVQFKDFENAFNSLSDAGGLFEGATKRQSQTIGGLLSTLGDNFTLLQTTIAKSFGPIIKTVLGDLIEVVQSFNATLSDGEAVNTFIEDAIEVGKTINQFVIRPFEGAIEIGEFLWDSVITGINQVLRAFGFLGGKVADFLKSFGVDNGLTQFLKTFEESTEEVGRKSVDNLAKSLDTLPERVFENDQFTVAANEYLEKVAEVVRKTNETTAQVKPITPLKDPETGEPTFGTEEDLNTIQLFADSFTKGFTDIGIAVENGKAKLADFKKNFDKFAQGVAKGLKQGIGQGAGNAFAAFGKALATGEDAFDAFGKAFIAQIGQIAVAQGTSFILQGIGYLFVPGFQGLGTSLIAAGAALATFGGALSAVAGGGGASAAGGGGVTTGSGGIPSSDTQTLGEISEEEREPAVNVVVNQNAPSFDVRETGKAIVDILQETFDEEGVRVRQGAFA